MEPSLAAGNVAKAGGGTRKPAREASSLPYRVYTDGACSNNQAPGGQPGGWAAVFVGGPELSGGDPHTTNNRMELMAAIQALAHTEPGAEVEVYSDSAYVVNAFRQNWFAGWQRRGWRNAKGDPVENQDLWRALYQLAKERRVTWHKVRGHSGDPYNERADRLAVAAMQPYLRSPAR